jgi:hypothetical protein
MQSFMPCLRAVGGIQGAVGGCQGLWAFVRLGLAPRVAPMQDCNSMWGPFVAAMWSGVGLRCRDSGSSGAVLLLAFTGASQGYWAWS